MTRAGIGREAPLRVLAWDHPRATRPLAACAAAWERRTGSPFVVVTRSLASFGDDVPEADGVDLVLIDHPHIGAAAAAGAIVPLDELVEPSLLAAIEADAIGSSQASYRHGGRTWALAVDAACQALAVHDEALAGRLRPTTWSEVMALVEAVPGRVAVPLHPAHALSSLLSLLAARDEQPGEELATTDGLRSAVAVLAGIAEAGPAAAYEWEPPDALEALQKGALTCIPLVYAYVGYDVTWSDAPAATHGGQPGSILGGVGVAVLSGAPAPHAAAELAGWLAGASTQIDLVATAGGQPSSRAAWSSPDADPLFPAVRWTAEVALARPNDPWWPAFQREGGEVLTDGLRRSTDPSVLAERVQATYRSHRRPGA